MPKRAIVEISPTRTQIALLKGGRVAASACAHHDAAHHELPAMLAAAAERLPSLVAQCAAAGAEATVIYHSPTAVCGVYACPKSAGAAGAERAARLALTESAEFPLAVNPHDIRALCADHPADGGPAQAHTLGVAESDESARAVAAALSGAGLTPAALIPAGAAAIPAACRRAMSAGADAVAVVVSIGEQASVLSGCAHGRLKFTREVGIGSEAFVDALTREIRPSDPGAPAVQLTRDEARRLVTSIGIPTRAQDVDPARGLKGDAVLPLMQPVLQRLLVEIRQSLRFGLEEGQREAAVLVGMGPGAGVPRLLGLIGEQCALKLSDTAAGPGGERGLTSDYLAENAAGVRLLPRHLGRQTNLRALQRALWTGIAAAAALVAGQAVITRHDTALTRREIAGLEKRLHEASAAGAVKAGYFAAQTALAGARSRMAARMTPAPDWDAVLSALASGTPQRIQLDEIDMRLESAGATLRLSGTTPLTGGQDAAIKSYLDALSAIPVVRSCRLGATQRADSPRGPVQAFEMVLTLVEVPADAKAPTATPAQASAQEEQP